MNPTHPERRGPSGLPSIPDLARAALVDLRRILVPLILFEVAYKGLIGPAWIVGAAWLLPAAVASDGRGAVVNTDIAAFAITPRGLLVGLVAGGAATWVLLFEHVGVMAIAALGGRGHAVTVRRLARMLAASALRLLRVGTLALLALVATAVPSLLLALAAYLALHSRHDINYYLAARPPSFEAALAIVSLLFAGTLAAGLAFSTRWSLALPILLLEALPARAALRESWRRVRGASWRVALVLVGWQVVGFLLSALAIGAFRRVSAFALDQAGHRASIVIPLVTILLACHGLILAVLSFVAVTVHCLLIMRIYAERPGEGSHAAIAAAGGHLDGCGRPAPHPRRLGLVVAATGLGFLAVAIFGGSARTGPGGRVEVTAHRGDSLNYPENTLEAVRGAIDAGADYAEIDVHQTADGAIVLIHDDDLMRVAGDPCKIWDLTLAEARSLDVGREFGPAHAGARIPTLEEVIALARGRIKLNIELKFRGKDRSLAGAVAGLVRREGFESECIVSSLDYEGLVEANRHNPRLRTAAIVTYALGDITRLRVDALSINRRILTDRLLRAAKARGMEVGVWTVDDPGGMVDLMERGVTSIVTNKPRLLVEIRREREGLSEIERRLLVARRLLGMGR